jgi:hypothetical protein
MMGIRSRAVGALAVGAAAAVAVAVAAPAAQAGVPRSAHGRNAAVVLTAVGEKGGKPARDPVLAGAATRFGLPADRLERALADVKKYIAGKGKESKAGLLDPAVLRVFARSLGVPVTRAQAVARYLEAAWQAGGKGKGKPTEGALPPGAVAFFAKTLHVSKARAAAALKQIFALAQGPKGSVDPRSAAFARIARGLGVTPKQLNAALVALKKFLATQEPGKPAPGKPDPGKPAPGKPAPGKPDPGKPGTPKPATAA